MSQWPKNTRSMFRCFSLKGSADHWWTFDRFFTDRSLLLSHPFSNHCDLSGSHWCGLVTNRIFLCSKLHLFPSQSDSFPKTQQPIGSKGFFFKETTQMARELKTTFATFNKPTQYWINNIFVQTKKTCI